MVDLHLTSIRLNQHHPAVQAETRDVCRMHARIIDATVGMPEGADIPRALFALPRRGLLVIRAPEPVTAVRLPAGFATAIHHREWTPPGPGRHHAVLAWNPVKQTSQCRPDGSRCNVRKPITERREQIDRLRMLLSPMMNRLDIRVTGEMVHAGWRRDGHKVTHRLVVVELRGEVTDYIGLTALAINGIGKARAYGGGLSVWEKL